MIALRHKLLLLSVSAGWWWREHSSIASTPTNCEPLALRQPCDLEVGRNGDGHRRSRNREKELAPLNMSCARSE